MPLVEKNINNWKIVDDTVVLNDDYLKKGLDKSNKWGKFKKITGTRLTSIFGLSKYNSPFKTWMQMVNLFKDDMDPTLAHVGQIIEPLIKKYVENQTNTTYLTHDLNAIGWDAFQENEIFGGVPDGEPLIDGKINYSNNSPMLEIKTTSIDKISYRSVNGNLQMQKDSNGLPIVAKKGEKKKEWFENDLIKIPVEYKFQLGLYMYLRNVEKGIFAIGFLEPIDYLYPEKFNINEREIHLVEFSISDKAKFKKYIDYAAKWFDKYIKTGISPKMTEEDKKWLNSNKKI
ncbi:MAG: hypothetical protein LBB95_01755 [Mycoplasmataceae bacterium]|nr:hypothetical protein [Mycoplasmataceae bacterium]